MLNRGIFLYPARGTRAYINAAHTDGDIGRTVDAVVEFLSAHHQELR